MTTPTTTRETANVTDLQRVYWMNRQLSNLRVESFEVRVSAADATPEATLFRRYSRGGKTVLAVKEFFAGRAYDRQNRMFALVAGEWILVPGQVA